jgi:hypothetical protein
MNRLPLLLMLIRLFPGRSLRILIISRISRPPLKPIVKKKKAVPANRGDDHDDPEDNK